MTGRQARCSCGQLNLDIIGDPVRVSVCHCLECQRRTGSAFGVQARFDRANVRITGQSTEYIRRGDSGLSISFHFCPGCGTTVYWEFPGCPGVMSVAVGAFADPTFHPPTVAVYESRQHSWVNLTGIQQRET